jgi:hypothetical protein
MAPEAEYVGHSVPVPLEAELMASFQMILHIPTLAQLAAPGCGSASAREEGAEQPF